MAALEASLAAVKGSDGDGGEPAAADGRKSSATRSGGRKQAASKSG